MNPAAQALHVSKRFGNTQALCDVSVSIHFGEILGLAGRNGAGKSTLVNLLAGAYAPDAGEIVRHAPAACVYQHPRIVPGLSVAENVFLGRYEERSGLIAWNRMRERAAELLDRWNVQIDPGATAGDLPIEERQLIEIVRALSIGARFVILDEPTAWLERGAVRKLFDALKTLRDGGVGILYISHHLHEVYELCDTLAVLRDGTVALDGSVAEISKGELVQAMTGELPQITASTHGPVLPAEETADAPQLSLEKLCGAHFRDVTFTVNSGEIVGLAGNAASGRTAVAEATSGLRPPSAGNVRAAGVLVRTGSPAHALQAGIAVVPRDRLRQGIVAHLSVAENVTISIADRLGSFGFIAPSKRGLFAQKSIADVGIVGRSDQAVDELSGGNQQKAVLARALASDPRVLVLIDPTAGVDVRSKEQLHGRIRAAAENGAAVLMACDDVEDLRLCDRVLVMLGGSVVSELNAGWSEAQLIALMEGVHAFA